jgi:hypothetical protein
MKAMAMGAIPVTSVFPNSTLPDLTPPFDLGIPTETVSDVWLDLWSERVIHASTLDAGGALGDHRQSMKTHSRVRHSWRSTAAILHGIFSTFDDRTQSLLHAHLS